MSKSERTERAALSENDIIRASSSETTKRPVVHESEEHGVGILWTPSIDRQQARADCRKEFSDDEIIGVPGCLDCGRSRDLRYYWEREVWCCRNCGRTVPVDGPGELPQEVLD
jgi:ribosomal protein L37AE/L43A